MSDRNLLRIQAASGLAFAVFVAVHLVNLAFAGVSAEAYDGFQARARAVYQQPLVEAALVVLPLLVHAGAALARLRRSGFRRTTRSWRSRLHRLTGYYLLLVIGGHVLATRSPSFLLGFHPGFAGLSFSLWWVPALFYPYYTLFALCGLYHLANGLGIAASVFGRPLPERVRHGAGFWLPIGVAGTVLVVGVMALGGWLYEIPDPVDNDYARMWEDLGVDLRR